MEMFLRYSYDARRLHAFSIVEIELGARCEYILRQILYNEEITHTVCFNVSHFVLVNIADAVGSSKSD
jgi:hypothetical protein